MKSITSTNLPLNSTFFLNSPDASEGQWLNKAQEALTPEHMKSWVNGIRNSAWDIPQMVSGYMLPDLTNAYISMLNQKIGVCNKYILNKPFLDIEHTAQGDIQCVRLSPEINDKVQAQLRSYVSNIMDQENIWTELIKWFWNHSVGWTLGLMSTNFGVETQYRMSKKDWSEAYSKHLCYSDQSYFAKMFDLYAHHFSELLVDSLLVDKTTLASLEEFLKLRKNQVALPNLFSPASVANRANYLTTFSMAHFQQLRKVIAAREFSLNETSIFPQASLNTASGSVQGSAIIKPTKRGKSYPQELIQDMNDETVDVLDALCHLWIKHASEPQAMIPVSADDILNLRGLQEQKNGLGQRGGYKNEWRLRVAHHIEILNSTCLSLSPTETGELTDDETSSASAEKDRACDQTIILAEIPSSLRRERSTFHWLFRPGNSLSRHLTGSWRQTALLSNKVLQFDPYRQAYEKRAARYFSWQWRNRHKKALYLEPIRVKTILDAICLNYQKGRPSKVIERFEKMMDTLQDAGVITTWQYDHIFNNWRDWIKLKVTVEPPQEIMDHYDKIKGPSKRQGSNPSPLQPKEPSISFHEIKAERQRRKLTQMQAAEEIGIDQTTISKLENGRQQADHKTTQKIKKWLSRPPLDHSNL